MIVGTWSMVVMLWQQLSIIIIIIIIIIIKWRLRANVIKSAVMVFSKDAVNGCWK